MESLATQLYGISKGLKHGEFDVPDIGEIVPASLMLQELDGLRPTGCSYMNNWGCERLGATVDEVNALGDAYYERYFVAEEMQSILAGVHSYMITGNFDKPFNLFQRVKLYGDTDYTWFYTVLKVITIRDTPRSAQKMAVLSSPVTGMDSLIARVNKTLEQDPYIRLHYRQFAMLTNREKEIITLLANGKSTSQITDQLFISTHTVSTHRKNIIRKTGCKSFAQLMKFAIAFDLL